MQTGAGWRRAAQSRLRVCRRAVDLAPGASCNELPTKYALTAKGRKHLSFHCGQANGPVAYARAGECRKVSRRRVSKRRQVRQAKICKRDLNRLTPIDDGCFLLTRPIWRSRLRKGQTPWLEESDGIGSSSSFSRVRWPLL